MMTHPPTEPDIDALLHGDFAGPVADDGFSAQVMQALPPRRPRRALLLPLAALIGGLLAWLSLLPSPLLQGAGSEWLAGQMGGSLAVVCVVLLGVGLLGCGWALEENA